MGVIVRGQFLQPNAQVTIPLLRSSTENHKQINTHPGLDTCEFHWRVGILTKTNLSKKKATKNSCSSSLQTDSADLHSSIRTAGKGHRTQRYQYFISMHFLGWILLKIKTWSQCALSCLSFHPNAEKNCESGEMPRGAFHRAFFSGHWYVNKFRDDPTYMRLPRTGGSSLTIKIGFVYKWPPRTSWGVHWPRHPERLIWRNRPVYSGPYFFTRIRNLHTILLYLDPKYAHDYRNYCLMRMPWPVRQTHTHRHTHEHALHGWIAWFSHTHRHTYTCNGFLSFLLLSLTK